MVHVLTSVVVRLLCAYLVPFFFLCVMIIRICIVAKFLG